MFQNTNFRVLSFVLASLLAAPIGRAASAQDSGWRVAKASGEVWLRAKTAVAEDAPLNENGTAEGGDTIRTGKKGRVLLKRGEETLLIAPNSVVSVPQAKDGEGTTVVQQAGSIVLDVEKRSSRNFEVVTPYLAAVVKGTRFRVSVDGRGARVDVLRGQVEVADFKSGKFAMVMPGQVATVPAQGGRGLTLRGAGSLGEIQQGTPRASGVKLVPVPRGGLTGPRDSANSPRSGALRGERRETSARVSRPSAAKGASGTGNPGSGPGAGDRGASRSPTKIGAPLGEVRVDFQKVTNGLAHAARGSSSAKAGNARDTVWNAANPKGSNAVSPGPGAANSAGAYGEGPSASGIGNGNGFGQVGAVGASSASGGRGNGNGEGNGGSSYAQGIGQGDGNGSGKSQSNGNSQGGGSGQGNATSDGQGKGQGNGQSNASGNGNGSGQGNGNGQSNGNSQGNGGGNQGNAGGQGNSGSQVNAGAQGSAGPSGNSGNQGISGGPGNSGNQGNGGTQGNGGSQGATGSRGRN